MHYQELKPGIIVQHYKGELYKILYAECWDKTHDMAVVIYSPVGKPEKIYVRAKQDFLSEPYDFTVNKRVPRFTVYNGDRNGK